MNSLNLHQKNSIHIRNVIFDVRLQQNANVTLSFDILDLWTNPWVSQIRSIINFATQATRKFCRNFIGGGRARNGTCVHIKMNSRHASSFLIENPAGVFLIILEKAVLSKPLKGNLEEIDQIRFLWGISEYYTARECDSIPRNGYINDQCVPNGSRCCTFNSEYISVDWNNYRNRKNQLLLRYCFVWFWRKQ